MSTKLSAEKGFEYDIERLSLLLAGTDAHAIILLLHGMNFQAKTWLESGTLQALTDRPLYSVAVDLPGYGETGGKPIQAGDQRGIFLSHLIHAVKGRLGSHLPVVVITPSMSGSYIVPFLNEHPGEIDVWIAIAPTTLDALENKDSPIPVLAVYGEKDPMKDDVAMLRDIYSNSAETLIVPDAGHACYLDNSQYFNTKLMNYITKVTQRI